jgi:hypothetical protein
MSSNTTSYQPSQAAPLVINNDENPKTKKWLRIIGIGLLVFVLVVILYVVTSGDTTSDTISDTIDDTTSVDMVADDVKYGYAFGSGYSQIDEVDLNHNDDGNTVSFDNDAAAHRHRWARLNNVCYPKCRDNDDCSGIQWRADTRTRGSKCWIMGKPWKPVSGSGSTTANAVLQGMWAKDWDESVKQNLSGPDSLPVY